MGYWENYDWYSYYDWDYNYTGDDGDYNWDYGDYNWDYGDYNWDYGWDYDYYSDDEYWSGYNDGNYWGKDDGYWMAKEAYDKGKADLWDDIQGVYYDNNYDWYYDYYCWNWGGC